MSTTLRGFILGVFSDHPDRMNLNTSPCQQYRLFQDLTSWARHLLFCTRQAATRESGWVRVFLRHALKHLIYHCQAGYSKLWIWILFGVTLFWLQITPKILLRGPYEIIYENCKELRRLYHLSSCNSCQHLLGEGMVHLVTLLLLLLLVPEEKQSTWVRQLEWQWIQVMHCSKSFFEHFHTSWDYKSGSWVTSKDQLEEGTQRRLHLVVALGLISCTTCSPMRQLCFILSACYRVRHRLKRVYLVQNQLSLYAIRARRFENR